MFKGNSNGTLGIVIGGAFAIFTIVWWIGLNYCPESPCNYDYKHSHGPTDGLKQHQGLIPRPDLPNFTLQPEPEFAEHKPNEYEYADLTAQENMARATNWIAWFSMLAFVTAGAGVLLLVRNLNVTREVGRDQSRAYVHVKSVRWLEDSESSEFTMFVENSGATPVKRFEIFAECLTKDPMIELPSRIQPIEMKGWNGLPSNDVFQLKFAPKFIPNEDAILARDILGTYLIFRGIIRYTTIFNEIFESEFSFMGRGSGMGQSKPEKYGILGTKMSRTTEVIRVFELID
jgi:hypothetical protein